MMKVKVLDNVYDLVTLNMEQRFSERVALRFYDKETDTVTAVHYKDYARDIRRAVSYFQSTIPDIKGKKICLLNKNSYEYAVNTFGIILAGGVLVLLNQHKSWDELSYELELVDPAAILTDGDDYGTKEQLEAAYGSILRPMDGFRAYEPVAEMPRCIGHDDLMVLMFTSGTTGRAKAVPLTSINEVLSAHDVMIHFPMNYRDVTMNTTPWFHRGGLHCGGPCPTFYAGATMVIMPKFDADKTLQYVSRYKISFVVGVPTVLESLADEQERQGYDLHTLRGIVTMGSPLERGACIRYQRVLTPNIFNGYGTTETLWNTFLRPFDLPDGAGTAGRAMVDDDVRVVRVYEDRHAEPDDLVATDSHEVGEVIISSPAKSPYVYVNNPEETEKKYYKGFIYTNDLATWNEKQFITICGRKDDMIISSGENIYPTEVEEVINQHPKVKDCIVTSTPDKIRGQKVTAYVVPADESLTPEELDQFCKDSPDIANFKRPRYYRFVSQIPFNATGKKLHYKIKNTALDDLKNGLLYEV